TSVFNFGFRILENNPPCFSGLPRELRQSLSTALVMRGSIARTRRLLAQYHHNLTRLDAFVVHHHVRDCVACFLSTEAPRRAWVASSYARSRRASKPRTAPAFSVAATCTAPSRKSEPCGWSARRGCWCGPAGLLGCSSTPSAWGTSPHPVVPLPRPTPARPETPGRARSGLGDSLLGESPWGCRTASRSGQRTVAGCSTRASIPASVSSCHDPTRSSSLAVSRSSTDV